jgi:hypothetical protein
MESRCLTHQAWACDASAQGWNDPWMVAYAHSHGIRVLQAAGGPVSGYTNTSGAAKCADPAYRAEQVVAFNQSIRGSGLDGWG